LKTNNKAVKTLAMAAFPKYQGRKFFVEIQQDGMDLRSSWQDGSRDYFTFVRLSDLQTCAMPPQSQFDKPISGMHDFWIPEGFVCVRRSFFCGRETGLTVIMSASSSKGFLAADQQPGGPKGRAGGLDSKIPSFDSLPPPA
jgi:hypothetical protein